MLSKVLRVYSTGHRKNDFSGAKNFYDIWVIDEPTERERRSSSSYFHQEEAEQEMNKLLTILDGQPCRLDGKYEKRWIQSMNVPIILIGKALSTSFSKSQTPWAERIMPRKRKRKSSLLQILWSLPPVQTQEEAIKFIPFFHAWETERGKSTRRARTPSRREEGRSRSMHKSSTPSFFCSCFSRRCSCPRWATLSWPLFLKDRRNIALWTFSDFHIGSFFIDFWISLFMKRLDISLGIRIVISFLSCKTKSKEEGLLQDS